MIVLGVDPGTDGGLALTDAHGHVSIRPMPMIGKVVDIREIARWIDEGGSLSLAVLEEPQMRPRELAAAVSTTQRNFGRIEGALMLRSVPIEIVQPKDWQRELGLAITKPKKLEDSKAQAAQDRRHRKKIKDGVAAWCARTFPNAKIRPESGKGSQGYHDGMTDALAIAEYGRRLLAQRGAA